MENRLTENIKRGNPQWVKGQSGNPKGRPEKPEAVILREALISAKNKQGKHLIEHAIELAYTDNAVLIAILKKILPDQIKGEGFGDSRIIVIHRADRAIPEQQTR